MSEILLSTVKGIGFPVKTTDEKLAIADPVEGAVVYDSDLGQLSVYASGSWQAVGSGAGGFNDFLLMGS